MLSRLKGLANRVASRQREPAGPTVQMVLDGPLRGLRLQTEPESPYTGDYEPAFAQALLRLARPGTTAVDAGAHYGYFTVLLAQAVGPDGAVVAFEADADNAAVVRRNAQLNGFGHVTVELAAIADREQAVAPLYAARSGGSMEWTLSRDFAEREGLGPEDSEERTARLVSLSDYFDGRPVALVKMDIEGAEAIALPAATAWLAHMRPDIVLEFHREVGWPAIEALREAGYGLETLDGLHQPWPDGPGPVPYQLVARHPLGPRLDRRR